MGLKPAPDIFRCLFLLRHTRNQHGLSAITTHLVSIVNAYNVYNNDHFRHSNDLCYIQNHVIINRVIKRLMCTWKQFVLNQKNLNCIWNFA